MLLQQAIQLLCEHRYVDHYRTSLKKTNDIKIAPQPEEPFLAVLSFARHTVPFSLLTGVLVCMILYVVLQFVTVTVIGMNTTDRPLAETASRLLGRSGEMFVTLSIMLSTYGWVSGALLNLPRLASSLASRCDFPAFLAKLHPRFNTPASAIVFCAAIVWLMAASGTFLWAAAVSGSATILIYTGTCSALIRLRQQHPKAEALRIPFGDVLAIAGIFTMLILLTRLSFREAVAVAITALLAALNWWWAKRRERRGRCKLPSCA